MKCEKCGADINEMTQSCSNCGFSPQLSGDELYAGFWKRLIAYVLDSIIIGIPGFILSYAITGLIGYATMKSLTADFTEADMLNMAMTGDQSYVTLFTILAMIPSILMFILYLFYFAGFESSYLQATPAKKIIGIKVTDLQGRRISFSKALIRNLGRIASSILFIGYIIIGFTAKKQGLHDMIAGCLVINANADL